MTEKTLVTFLLDKSGSMASIKHDTMAAFNAYLEGMRDTDGIHFTLLQFDTNGVEKTCVNEPIKTAPTLNDANYQPNAATPLIDAAVETIKAVEEAVRRRDTFPKVVICIQTDGEENSSTQHTWDELTALIKEKTALGWQFNFMGAGIDAYQQATRMGLNVNQTMSYDKSDRASTMSAYSKRGAATASFASGALADMSIGLAEKLSAGDKFADKADGRPQPTSASQQRRFVAQAKKPIVDKITL